MNNKSNQSKKIFIITGESSGDMHGANLARELIWQMPAVQIEAMGGPNLAAAGVKIVQNIDGLGVVGAVEIIRHIPKFKRIFDFLVRHLKETRPDALVLIDYPGFNLRFAEKVKKVLPETKIVYYITPQVWAWHKSRLKTMKRLLNLALVIFDFEEPLFKDAGVPVHFVGHPLLDILQKEKIPPEKIRLELGISQGERLIGLLPGSRQKEVERLLPVMLDGAKIMCKTIPSLNFVISCADKGLLNLVSKKLAASCVKFPVICGRFREVLAGCDAVAVASGTATLETAVFGKPMVVMYKMSALSYSLAKLLVNVKHISLANIIAGKTVVAELIQKAATPDRLASELLSILTKPEKFNQIQSELGAVKGKLGEPGASRRAAEKIIKIIS